MHKTTHRSDKEALTEIDSINRSHSRWSDHYAYRNIPFFEDNKRANIRSMFHDQLTM